MLDLERLRVPIQYWRFVTRLDYVERILLQEVLPARDAKHIRHAIGAVRNMKKELHSAKYKRVMEDGDDYEKAWVQATIPGLEAEP